MLQDRVEALEKAERIAARVIRGLVAFGSIQGDTETLTVTVLPAWEDGDAVEAV